MIIEISMILCDEHYEEVKSLIAFENVSRYEKLTLKLDYDNSLCDERDCFSYAKFAITFNYKLKEDK